MTGVLGVLRLEIRDGMTLKQGSRWWCFNATFFSSILLLVEVNHLQEGTDLRVIKKCRYTKRKQIQQMNHSCSTLTVVVYLLANLK